MRKIVNPLLVVLAVVMFPMVVSCDKWTNSDNQRRYPVKASSISADVDADGNIIEVTYKQETQYKYDEYSRPIQIERYFMNKYNEDDIKEGFTIYRLEYDGLNIVRTSVDHEGNILSTSYESYLDYTYEHPTEIIQGDMRGIYEYDGKNLISYREYYGDTLAYKSIYTYNGNNLISNRDYYGDILANETIYTYNGLKVEVQYNRMQYNEFVDTTNGVQSEVRYYKDKSYTKMDYYERIVVEPFINDEGELSQRALKYQTHYEYVGKGKVHQKYYIIDNLGNKVLYRTLTIESADYATCTETKTYRLDKNTFQVGELYQIERYKCEYAYR